MPYVERSNGVIVGTYYGLLAGVAEEFLPDDNPEVLAFQFPVTPPLPGPDILDGLLAGSAARLRDYLGVAPYVTSRTDLKALDTTKDKSANLAESGREGVFLWKTGNYSTHVAADTAEGVYVKATAIPDTAGAWVRHYDNRLNAKMFGAIGDGATDDTAAIQAAVNLASSMSGACVFIPAGVYLISSEILVNGAGMQIEGEGQSSTYMVLTDATQNGFHLTGARVGVRKLGFLASVSKSAGAAIIYDGVVDGYIEEIFSLDQFETIRLLNVVKVTVSGGYFVNPTPTTGRGVYISGGNDYYFHDVLVAGNASAQPESGFYLAKASAFYADTCGTIWCNIGLKVIVDSGDIVEHVFMSRCAWDTCQTHGMLIQALTGGTVRRFKSMGDWYATNGNHGAVIAPSGNVDGVHFIGCQFYNNGYSGASIQNGINVSFDACIVAGNSVVAAGNYHGIQFTANITRFAIRNCQIGPGDGLPTQQSRGISIETGASDKYIITGNMLLGDINPMFDGGSGANKIVKDNLKA